MGDGGVGGGGTDFGAGPDIGTGGIGEDEGITGGSLLGGAYGAVGPGTPGSEGASPGGGVEISPLGGAGAGPEAIPEPKAWETAIEKAGEKGEQKATISRKKRRRTLLTLEEGGVMQPAPVYRRSILGI